MAFESINDIDDALNKTELSVRELHTIWEQRQPVPDAVSRKPGVANAALRQFPWLQDDIKHCLNFVQRAMEKHEYLLVCDATTEMFRVWSGKAQEHGFVLVELRILLAQALSRLGYTRMAQAQLEPCAAPGFSPKLSRKLACRVHTELGNILRDEAQHATSRAQKIKTAEAALESYKQAIEFDKNQVEPLALAAAAALILSQPDEPRRHEAHELARRILELTEDLEPNFLNVRARATASAVLGDVDAAAATFSQLRSIEGAHTTNLADSRHYARYLAEALGRPREFFTKAFPPLQLIVFAGHMPDLPDQDNRFPAAMIPQVRQLLRKRLEEDDVRAAVVSAAAGADLLFVEALMERKGTVHLVLPWSQDEFVDSSVGRFEPPGQPPLWRPLYDRAIAAATTVRELGQQYAPSSDVGWRYMTEVGAGIALHVARVARLDIKPMVLWDKLPGRGVGGTADFAAFWRHHLRREPTVIEFPVASDTGSTAPAGTLSWRCERSVLHQEVKSMLFADIVGYSKLTEDVIPEFIEVFLERVSQLVAESKHRPRSLNTWGDAVYAIFDYAHDAGCFALRLVQMIKEGEEDWIAKGLYWEEPQPDGQPPIKRPLNVRIGLHTGPVFMHHDPVVRRLGFTGAHVNRAARIEPVAKPGEVFASEEFAALAELTNEIHRVHGGHAPDDNDGFVCEYAGSMQLAKNYPGRYRIYRVLPKRIFAIEELAKAAHEYYLEEARKRGETPETNPAMRPWDKLPDDLRESNRGQVADIPNKLRFLGYELAPNHGMLPSTIVMPDDKVEELAVREHQRWMENRIANGWKFAPTRDNNRKYHPLLVKWEMLSEAEKEKDRDTVRNLPRLIERAGFRVRPLKEAAKEPV